MCVLPSGTVAIMHEFSPMHPPDSAATYDTSVCAQTKKTGQDGKTKIMTMIRSNRWGNYFTRFVFESLFFFFYS